MNETRSGSALEGRSVVVLGGLRTPFARAGRELCAVPPWELARVPAEELLVRTAFPAEEIDELVVGCSAPPLSGTSLARTTLLRLGLPESTPTVIVQRGAVTGLEAIADGVDRIRSGASEVVLVVGVDSMSMAPHRFRESAEDKLRTLAAATTVGQRARSAAHLRPADFLPRANVELGEPDPVCDLSPAEAAESLAREFRISREAQDELALASHHRVLKAMVDGVSREEIVSLWTRPERMARSEDTAVRKGQSLEALAALPALVDPVLGTVTDGNRAPPGDGGAALLLAAEDVAQRLGLEPRGRIVASGRAGCAPERMGLAGVFAAVRALDAAGVSLDEVDRVEIDELYCAHVLAMREAFASPAFARAELGRDGAVGEIRPESLNVHGGATALALPPGAAGIRLVLSLLGELSRCELRRALAVGSSPGGIGGALILERDA